MTDAIVIVGGGHAAAQLCSALAEAGQGSRVHVVCEEAVQLQKAGGSLRCVQPAIAWKLTNCFWASVLCRR